jgi:hypothetical protein
MRGGKRPGAGRPRGSPNRATQEIRGIAQAYTAEAIETLAQIMRTAASDTARLNAANALLDRAYGKPTSIETEDVPTDVTEMSME